MKPEQFEREKQYQVIRFITQRMHENGILTKDELDVALKHYQKALHPVFSFSLNASPMKSMGKPQVRLIKEVTTCQSLSG